MNILMEIFGVRNVEEKVDLSHIHEEDAVYRPNLLSSALINEGVTPIRQSTLDRFTSMRLA
jgi:hypothetical protein|tara:strand:+ start:52 stop:234 length:183 start_codon:yes stop_codon:yes gene_type:complete